MQNVYNTPKGKQLQMLECCYQSVGRRSVGTARVKSHVIRAQNASKLGEKA